MSTTSKSGFDYIFPIAHLTLIAIQQMVQDVTTAKFEFRTDLSSDRLAQALSC